MVGCYLIIVVVDFSMVVYWLLGVVRYNWLLVVDTRSLVIGHGTFCPEIASCLSVCAMSVGVCKVVLQNQLVLDSVFLTCFCSCSRNATCYYQLVFGFLALG